MFLHRTNNKNKFTGEVVGMWPLEAESIAWSETLMFVGQDTMRELKGYNMGPMQPTHITTGKSEKRWGIGRRVERGLER